MLRISLRIPRSLSRRAFASRNYSASPRPAAAFGGGPAPPRLPKEEQELFERLQAQSTGAFSTPRSKVEPSLAQSASHEIRARINQSPGSQSAAAGDAQVTLDGNAKIKEGEELHPNMRRGAPPEFEGDVNPKTGEVGGPKNEPLRWGHGGDWSYNGRVTDF